MQRNLRSLPRGQLGLVGGPQRRTSPAAPVYYKLSGYNVKFVAGVLASPSQVDQKIDGSVLSLRFAADTFAEDAVVF